MSIDLAVRWSALAILACVAAACDRSVERGGAPVDHEGAAAGAGGGGAGTGDGGDAESMAVGAGGGPRGGGGLPPGGFSALEGCLTEEVVVTPTPLSPTDGCRATFRCEGDVELTVECDGENDGTNTSLCSCYVGSDWGDGGLVAGEGAIACLEGFQNCTSPD